MSEWLGGVVSRAPQHSDWLAPKRQASLELLRSAQWPTRKTEAWKYTPVRAIAEASFNTGASVADPVVIEKIDGLNSIDLVLVDGELQTDLQQLNLPTGLSITSIADAPADTQNWAMEKFSSAKPNKHLFGLVNDVLSSSGLIIDVEAGVEVESLLRVVTRLTTDQEAHTRLLVRVNAGAKLKVFEDYSGNVNSFNTGFAEYDIAESAELEHYRFALQTDQALSVGGSHFDLAGSAQLNSTLVAFGSRLSRLDIDVNHLSEHANAKLNAIYLLDSDELFDLHSSIEHVAAHGTTEENVRGIVGDKARAVFNGRIHIHRDAQENASRVE